MCASSVAEAVETLSQEAPDLVVTDIKMPRVSGLDLVRHVRQNLQRTEVVVITGYPTVQGAVDAVRDGAIEYLAKPFTDEELFSAVERGLDKLEARLQTNTEQPGNWPEVQGMVGSSKAMQEVYRAISKASETTATVLISGESGTGKELVARAIHYAGPRAKAPFVPVNCGAIPDGLLESELFGYVKGSFTGANESRAGFFLTADGGTLFLDEVGDTSLEMQVKLLRVLQDKQVMMVGGRKGRTVDVRVVAATNKELFAMVRKGSFREDLFFRVNVITIDVPPLRKRDNDLLALARHFVVKYSEELNKSAPTLSDEAIDVMRVYSWPGNVRELENVIQRAVVMNDTDIIDVRDLPPHMRFTAGGGYDLHRTLVEVETVHIKKVLSGVDGNKTRAAKILGIDRKTLREKLKR